MQKLAKNPREGSDANNHCFEYSSRNSQLYSRAMTDVRLNNIE